jgi:hypothetical protein
MRADEENRDTHSVVPTGVGCGEMFGNRPKRRLSMWQRSQVQEMLPETGLSLDVPDRLNHGLLILCQ